MSYTLRKSTVVRDFMLWLFDVPFGEPYISATVDILWERPAAYLEKLNAAGGARVTTHHLFVAALGRLYTEFPAVNARVFGQRIYGMDTVDVVMPVNLLGTGVKHELSMVIVKGVEKLDPRGVAESIRPQVASERSGRSGNRMLQGLIDAGTRQPGALRAALSAVARLTHDPRTAGLVAREFPFSTLVTNVGASIGAAPGIRFRAVSFSPPEKLVHVGTLFGLGPIERSAYVDGDTIRIAPVLPTAFIFDHRLIDGVMAGRVLTRLAEILQDPEATWPGTVPTRGETARAG
jgi:hypothetical protein